MLSAARIQEAIDPGLLPTPEQERIIESPLRPLLVVAGAGSGKTETMTMRVLWAVANHEEITPSSVLGLTFTKKAAGELGERLRRRLHTLAHMPEWEESDRERLDGEPVALTYNSFAQRIVQEHGLAIGLDPDLRMLGQAGGVQMMTEILANWPRVLHPDLKIADAAKKALSLAGKLADHGLDLDEGATLLDEFGVELSAAGEGNATICTVRAANEKRLALLEPIREFQRRKREEGFLDFSDQLLLATKIVTESPEAVKQIRAEHKCVLLDEFQDTSVIQMTFLSTLFHDHPVTAVGDPNQAIYGWRGASASSLESFLERFQGAEAREDQTLSLSTAWRNDRRILLAANKVAAPLRESADKAASPVLIESPEAEEGRVTIAYGQNLEEQTRIIADYVEGLRSAHRGERYSIAVLGRKRRPFLAIDRELRERGIPTQIIGLGGLLDQPAVADLRSTLAITADVQASSDLARLLVRADIGSADLAVLGAWARHLALEAGRDPHSALLLDAVDHPPTPGWRRSAQGPAMSEAGAKRLALLGQRLRRLRAMRGRGLVELAESAMGTMGILDDAIADPLGLGSREALDSFIDVIAGFEQSTPAPTLLGLLAWLDAAQEEENGLEGVALEVDPDAVQILTIHAAKGLEWDGVVIAGLSDAEFPTHRGKSVTWSAPAPAQSGWINDSGELPHPLRGDYEDLPEFDMDLTEGKNPSTAFKKWLEGSYKVALGAHLEREERRLAYVALTRAKHDELLVGSWINQAKTPREPSRYLEESRQALVKDLQDSLDSGVVSWGNGRRCEVDAQTRRLLEGELESLGSCITPKPEGELIEELMVKEEGASFPPQPGPSRRAIALAADKVRQVRAEMDSEREVFEILAELGDSARVRDVVALLEERRLNAEQHTMLLWSDQVPATSVSRLIDNPQAFAEQIRRPMPKAPSEYASLGTIFHAWAERQLHQASGELWEEPIVGVESLDEDGRARLERMQKNFLELDIVRNGRPLAIEEPFALELAGISVTGRIDAVFTDAQGRTVIVDWKTGVSASRGAPRDRLRYFATQLRLYRAAWMAVHEEESSVRPLLAFVSSGEVVELDELEKKAGLDPHTSLDKLLMDALDKQGEGNQAPSSSSTA